MTIHLAKRMQNAQPSATKAMSSKAASMAGQGMDIISLTQGEPDSDTPSQICEAGIAAIRDGRTRYTPVSGILPLREAISAKLQRDNGVAYQTNEIIVGCGAKQVIFNAFLATLDSGDDVIIPAPCWVSYPESVKLAGGSPVIVYCDQSSAYKLTAAQLASHITGRTKWLVLNTPANPTGQVYSQQELKDLASVLRQYPHILIMCDEIYEKLVYAPSHFISLLEVAPDLRGRILLINGVSKAQAMTGWRIGYGAGPGELVSAMTTIQGQTTSHTSSISQYAAIEAIAGDQSYLKDFLVTFQRRRDTAHKRVNAMPGMTCQLPSGAFYLFADCRALMGSTAPDGSKIESDADFAMMLLEHFGVAVVPGSSFLTRGSRSNFICGRR